MTEINHDDVEAELSQTSGHVPSIEHDDDGDNDDDGCSFDGMEVEDWLIKQQAKKASDCCWHQQAINTQEAKDPDQCFIDNTLASEWKGGSQGKYSQQQKMTCSTTADEEEGRFVELPLRPVGTLMRTETLDPTVILDAEAKTLASYENFFVAEVSPHDDRGVLVIEGVTTMDPRHRGIFTMLGAFVVASLIAIGAGLITNLFTLSSRNSALVAGGGDENTTTAPVSTPIISRGGNLSVTIGDVWSTFSPGGIENFAVKNGALDLFQELVTQPDKSFTFFSASKQADVMGGVGIAIITKTLSPMYNGHVLSGMESLLVDGMVAYEDMYDGMVLQSVAGYPLLIQLGPFRVNNNTMIPTEINIFFKNGVVHTSYQFPKPLVPWLGKSVYDVLVETNQARNLDLSTFIAMIDRYPDLKGQLQKDRALEGLTLFVPTNNAMTTVYSDLAVADDPTFLLQDFLLNHLVSGNFVRRCWQIIPTGTYISDTELSLETQAGQILSLEINDVVIINGDVTIVQEDVLSLEGVIQVIDKPLLI